MAPDIVRGGDTGHDKVCSRFITEKMVILWASLLFSLSFIVECSSVLLKRALFQVALK